MIGREFAFRILQTIMGMREELKSHLLNLQGLEFIYEKSLFPELEYIFKHALTQEVAYNSLLQKEDSRFTKISDKPSNPFIQNDWKSFMKCSHSTTGEVTTRTRP